MKRAGCYVVVIGLAILLGACTGGCSKAGSSKDEARSRVQSNESAAIGNLRTIVGAEVTFYSAKGEYATLDKLCAGKDPILVGDWSKARSGYVFTTLTATKSCFTCTATPEKPGVTGVRCFFTDCTGVIRATTDGTAATASSPPIGKP